MVPAFLSERASRFRLPFLKERCPNSNAQSLADYGDDRVTIPNRLGIREANDPETMPLNLLGPRAVVVVLPAMLAAVEFDHQFALDAEKIDGVAE